MAVFDRKVFVRYDVPGPALWHERWVLDHAAAESYAVVTPDQDVYVEDLSVTNEDLLGIRMRGAGGGLPVGIRRAQAYELPAFNAGRMAALRAEATRVADEERLDRAAVMPAMAAAVAPAQGASVSEGQVWVWIESTEEHPRGEIIELDGSEVLQGDVGLKAEGRGHIAIRRMLRTEVEKYKSKEASSDARHLGLSFQGVQREERQWRDVSNEIREERLEDWAVPGPLTSAWCVRFLNRRNGGPSDHHRWWVQNHALKHDAWGVAEHDNLMKILDRLGRYDGLDLANLAGVEVAFRRLQLIEYIGKGSGKGAKKNHDGTLPQFEATIFSGAHKEFGDVMVAPALLEYVAKEVESEAAVTKQVRKAREERATATKCGH